MLSTKLWITAFFLTFPFCAQSKEKRSFLPAEYESDGGHSLGFGHGGVAAVSGQSSVKANPAMLPLEKHYRVSAGYHWPVFGREYYQAGVVDSVTSSIASLASLV